VETRYLPLAYNSNIVNATEQSMVTSQLSMGFGNSEETKYMLS